MMENPILPSWAGLPTTNDGLYFTPGLKFLEVIILKKSYSHLNIESRAKKFLWREDSA
jgi:hypothetical protein